ncbi:cupin domain-containing protein [Flavihumibacter rivuli]|uniref:cupin domain-containing protein n=1 Tax=Flavihumibacter rivuli TaxID=2838156 RepID=UPI001EFBE93B|nr:cupin domain-containing protein [Flavihumibacter rivuli]ULQ57095.1 cupin domain-containing protein [Flavihumibacter rivuli]
MYLLMLTGLYLVIGNLLHRVIFPERKPEVSTFFHPGQQFYSKAEGFRQTVVKQENGHVHCRLEVEPFAAGPPKHIHDGFDEVFEIENGELSIWVGGEVKKLHPGEVIRIPKGTPHQPYNETADTIRTKGTFAFPEKFAYHLVQTYGYMESHPNFTREPGTIFQIAMLQQAGFDSYIVDGPPVFLQKLIGLVANPMARLLGIRSYYEDYNIIQGPTVVEETGLTAPEIFLADK